MEDEEVFSTEELRDYADQLMRIISETAPHRLDNAYPRELKVKGKVVSPMPRNLQLNGQVIKQTGDGYTVRSGYAPAPYALYANAKARWREGEHGPRYIERSIEKFKGFMQNLDWEEE
jgi:hypothetical protein